MSQLSAASFLVSDVDLDLARLRHFLLRHGDSNALYNVKYYRAEKSSRPCKDIIYNDLNETDQNWLRGGAAGSPDSPCSRLPEK
jgi:hypothetical protein